MIARSKDMSSLICARPNTSQAVFFRPGPPPHPSEIAQATHISINRIRTQIVKCSGRPAFVGKLTSPGSSFQCPGSTTLARPSGERAALARVALKAFTPAPRERAGAAVCYQATPIFPSIG